MAPIVIPATGTVKFITFALEGEHLEVRTGGKGSPWARADKGPEWSRPCVGLLFDDVPRQFAAGGESLSVTELVVAEYGAIYRVHDYMDFVMGGVHWDHSAHFFEPHITGPVSSPPLIRVVDEPVDHATASGSSTKSSEDLVHAECKIDAILASGTYIDGPVADGARCAYCNGEAHTVLHMDGGECDVCLGCGQHALEQVERESQAKVVLDPADIDPKMIAEYEGRDLDR